MNGELVTHINVSMHMHTFLSSHAKREREKRKNNSDGARLALYIRFDGMVYSNVQCVRNYRR